MVTRALGALCLAACAAAPPPPRPVAEEFVEVAYPPPPAQVEEMSESLEGHPECRWLDGHYEWRGRRWLWVSGEWVVPPAGCRYEPGVLDWGTGDPPKLYYTPPRWYAPGKVAGAGRDVDCPPATSCQSGPRRRR